MANETQAIMAQIQAMPDLDTLHPRALLMVDGLVVRYGGEAVATALTWLYAEARFELRVARERGLLEDGAGVAEAGIDYPVPEAGFAGPRWLAVPLAAIGATGLLLLWWGPW